LMGFTSPKDLADVSTETGVSISTLNYVKRRVNNVSEGNEKGILKLLEKAYVNADSKIEEAKKCKKEIRLILDCI
ncbi:MAG: hypothetical protein L0G30_07050, partial [Chryseobacterium sp.]|nr:hypothetical protein [Chryseobacterium sp.]